MPTYKTPGVYIEEISVFPPSVAAVETAIPAFIGYTEKAEDDDGSDLSGVPKRITSLLQYEEYFGKAVEETLDVKVAQTLAADGTTVTDTVVTFEPLPTGPFIPDFGLYYNMRLFFANGGGPCFVVSVGEHGTDGAGSVGKADLDGGINALEPVDEPTLLLFPDSVQLTDTQHGGVVNTALKQCAKLQDRFTIADVRNAVDGGTEDNSDVTSNFRDKLGTSDVDDLKYGAAYFPYLKTQLPIHTVDANVTIAEHEVTDAAGSTTDGSLKGKKLSESDVKDSETAVYNAVKRFLASAYVTLPPSGGVAGAYARTDARRGVWKAPANTGLAEVLEPAIAVTNDLNDGLNIDAGSGKSVNAIRAFRGKGTLIWGARTLAGNDNENKYVPVRRFLNFAEESIKKAVGSFVFEPNDANTWVKVKAMIENFLINQWRDGALTGAKPEHAFFVHVGLDKTMSAQDILDGYMIVEIGLAIVRPAEFIVLKFVQKMQES